VSISFQCKHCGKKLKAPESAAGKTSTCPGCGNQVTCPDPDADDEVVEMAIEPEKPSGFDPFADLGADKPYTMAVEPAQQQLAPGVRRPCPMCGEIILSTAAKCPHCGEVFEPTIKKVKKKGGKKKELRTVAVYQKYLIVSILIQILTYIALIIARSSGGPIPKGPSLVVMLLCLLALLAAGLAAMVFAFMLANKLYNIGVAILVIILSFIPCLGLIALLAVNNKATNLLRDRGHTVGFLGADLSEF
jgi:hypothetical protein